MKQLLGEFPCKIDAKGRLRLPSALLNQFEEDESKVFIVNRGFEKCLVLYPEHIWEEITAEIDELNEYDEQSRKFSRYFYRGATRLNPDSADRVNMPKNLLEWAGIGNEIVLSARKTKIEMWPKEKWNDILDDEPEDFGKLAQSVLGNKKKKSDDVS